MRIGGRDSNNFQDRTGRGGGGLGGGAAREGQREAEREQV